MLPQVKHSIIYLMVIPFVVLLLVIWVSSHRINDFQTSQVKIAESATNALAGEISTVISERNKLLDIFVANEADYIRRLKHDPDNENLKKIVETKLLYYFSDYFTFSIADNKGRLILDDYDGYIGDICRNDISHYAKTGRRHVQVHPNPYVYHTDVISQIDDDGGYFFASFSTDVFSRLLRLSSPEGQHLMLINTKVNDLIDITEQGSRLLLNRNNYLLTDEERQAVLAEKEIPGTYWKITSFHDKNLFDDFNYTVITLGAIIVATFLLATILMMVIIWRGEKRRISVEQYKDEMFSFFTHDLRAPLTSIYGTVQLLHLYSETHGFDKQTRTLVDSAVHNAKGLLSLIDDILDVQKLESGMVLFDRQKVELNALIQDVIKLNSRLADMHFVKVEFEQKPELYANIDERRFQQVLTNLLSNAIKYSPQHGVVQVSLTLDNSNAVIAVSDAGAGISRDVQETLFEKFTQGSSGDLHQMGSLGLGLSIVKYIVEEHGGQVRFESEIGQGTTFFVYIPLL